MKKAYKKEFDENVFNVRYAFFVGNRKTVNKYLKKKFKDKEGLGAGAAEAFKFNYKDGAIVQCIWLPSKKDIDYLIHEITHCVISTMEAKGMQVNQATTETAAYLSGYLYNQFVSKKKWERI